MSYRRLPQLLMLAPALLFASGSAQKVAATVWYPTNQSQTPLSVEADNISIEDARRVVKFWGHVSFVQGEVHLQCSYAFAWYVTSEPASKLVDKERRLINRIDCLP